MFNEIIIGFAFFVCSMVFHEFGHFIVARRKGYRAQIVFDGRALYTDWDSNTKDGTKDILVFGIVLGAIVLFIGVLINTLTFIFIPLYIMGIVKDLKDLRRLKE